MILLNWVKKITAALMTLMTSISMMISTVEAKINKKPFSSTIMHRLKVNSVDSGGKLIFSDSPEYVKEDGILYSDVVKGDARILFYHLNDTNVNKHLAVVVENISNKFNTIDITRGATTEPSADFLKVGKSVQTNYMANDFHDSVYMLKGDKKLLQDSMGSVIIKPGQLVYGVYDFYAAHPVRISVIMYPQATDPIEFMKQAKVLPKDEQQLRGTFNRMNRTLKVKKVYDPKKDGIGYVMIADNVNDLYKTGIDATDGSKVVNFGNYGINYEIKLKTKNNSKTRICLTPLGGSYAGAMRAIYKGESEVFLTPKGKIFFGNLTPKEPEHVKKSREEGLALLTTYTELAELGTYSGEVSFEYSPPGASNLPVHIILMPDDKE